MTTYLPSPKPRLNLAVDRVLIVAGGGRPTSDRHSSPLLSTALRSVPVMPGCVKRAVVHDSAKWEKIIEARKVLRACPTGDPGRPCVVLLGLLRGHTDGVRFSASSVRVQEAIRVDAIIR